MLQHLAEQGERTPFAAALLCAPMTGLRGEAAIRTILTLMPALPAVDERYFYGSGPTKIVGRDLVGNRVTQDQRRYRFTSIWHAADPRLALGSATIGWLRQAVRSIRRQDTAGFLERIAVPVTVLSATRDKLIDSTSHVRLAQRIADCRLETYADSQHEIMMELDPIRARFLAELDRFVETAAGSGPSPACTAGPDPAQAIATVSALADGSDPAAAVRAAASSSDA